MAHASMSLMAHASTILHGYASRKLCFPLADGRLATPLPSGELSLPCVSVTSHALEQTHSSDLRIWHAAYLSRYHGRKRVMM